MTGSAFGLQRPPIRGAVVLRGRPTTDSTTDSTERRRSLDGASTISRRCIDDRLARSSGLALGSDERETGWGSQRSRCRSACSTAATGAATSPIEIVLAPSVDPCDPPPTDHLAVKRRCRTVTDTLTETVTGFHGTPHGKARHFYGGSASDFASGARQRRGGWPRADRAPARGRVGGPRLPPTRTAPGAHGPLVKRAGSMGL